MKFDRYFQLLANLFFIVLFIINVAAGKVCGQSLDIQVLLTNITSDENYAKKLGIKEPELLNKIYELNNYKKLWNEGTEDFQKDFSFAVAQSESYGLDKEKYSIMPSSNALENEVLQTDGVLSFLNDIAFGTEQPDFVYNGLAYKKNACQSIEGFLLYALQKNDFKNALVSIQPSSKLYQALIEILQRIITVRQTIVWNEAIIESTPSLKQNLPLINKLYYLGILPLADDTLSIDEPKMIEALKRFERMFNLEEDGKLNRTVLQKLNTPMSAIREMLIENINKCRWFACMEHKKNIHINIPSTNLKLYASDSLLLTMKVIVGKPSTPTPVFCARLNQVIFFPYWNVPRSIAINEFLPVLKRDAHFLENNGIQVLDAKGQVIDENQLDWKKYNSKNFPYRFRQVTGCDNSLGIVKFDIEDPFSIYMHDTNHKELFGRDKRFLSHGCIRLEKPYELAAALLENQAQVNNFVKQRFNKNLQPVSLKLQETIPVFVSYFTVDISDRNEIVFYENIYHK